MADETNTQTTTDQQVDVDPVQPTTTTTDPVVTHGETTSTATDGKTQEELEAENAANQAAPADAVVADTGAEDGSALVQPVDDVQPSQPASPEQQAAEQHAEQVALDQAVLAQETLVEAHNQDVDGVIIPNDRFTQARELFASLLAGDLSEDGKSPLCNLGTLLGLHSKASAQADATGDYAPGDVHA